MTDFDRTPPQDISAEMAVLGAMMLSKDAVQAVTDVVTAADFYRPAHEAIFDAARAVTRAGNVPDAITVAAQLGDDLARFGGATYLHDCISALPSVGNAQHYAEIVRDRAVLRRLVDAGTKITQLGYSNSGDVDDLVATAQAEVATVQTRGRRVVTLGEVAERLVDRFGQDAARTTPTSWPELDHLIGGLAPGRLYVAAGRPGMGKSVLGAGLALSMAQRGSHAFLASAEMTQDELTARIMASICEVDHERIYHGTVNDLEQQRVSRAWGVIQGMPLHIEDGSELSVADIRAGARNVARSGPLGVIVVDYIGLLKPATRRKSDRDLNRQQEVAEMSRSLKVLAKELEVPVVMLAQLNRNVESRADQRPLLSDLRESGAIEQDADVVMLLYRDQDKAPDRIVIGVGKNRHGKLGPAHLLFNGPFQRIESPALTQGRWAS